MIDDGKSTQFIIIYQYYQELHWQWSMRTVGEGCPPPRQCQRTHSKSNAFSRGCQRIFQCSGYFNTVDSNAFFKYRQPNIFFFILLHGSLHVHTCCTSCMAIVNSYTSSRQSYKNGSMGAQLQAPRRQRIRAILLTFYFYLLSFTFDYQARLGYITIFTPIYKLLTQGYTLGSVYSLVEFNKFVQNQYNLKYNIVVWMFDCAFAMRLEN